MLNGNSGIGLVLTLMLAAVAASQESIVGRQDLIEIQVPGKPISLAVVDAQLWFRGLANGPRGGAPETRTRSLMFRRHADTLQAFIQPGEEQPFAGQAGVHLWYLTADYSTEPPRVHLTKEADKDSRWIFEAASNAPRNMKYFIRNEAENGKSGWLNLSDEAMSTRSARAGLVKLHEVVLSNDRKQPFEVRSYKGADGK